MAGAQTAGGIHSGEDRVGKFEDILLLVFCSLVAVAGLVVVVWQLATGRLLSIDGLWLAGISLTLSAVFGGNVAWAIHTGEVKQLLGSRPKDSTAGAAPGPTPSGAK
jgi:hypothetical protein